MGYQFPKMRAIFYILIFALACVCQAESEQISVTDIDWQPLVVHFDQNSYSLKATDKAKIQDLLKNYDIAGQSKIFVVGYTDTIGKKEYNYKLSRYRAQHVEKVLIKTLSLKPEQVIAIGKGPENPAADNKSKSGRAENRRVEIYMCGVIEAYRSEDGRVNPETPAAVRSLVRQAKALLRRQQLDEALYKLHQGRALGADQFADWHAAYGIAGFYAGVNAQAVQAHLNLALQLDPFQYEARDFLGRLDARRKVAEGHVHAGMGQSPAAPIAVNAIAQEYEFLALFQAQPVAHRQLTAMPVHVWECRDSAGRPVTYYFDHSAIHAGAFLATEPAVASAAAPRKPGGQRPAASPQNPVKFQKIWESKLFR
jgi:OOP family OmpA-OmpF porin